MGGWITIIFLTYWANRNTTVREIISIRARRTFFNTGSGFIISEGEQSLVAVIDTSFCLNLPEHIKFFWAYWNTAVCVIISKFQSCTLFHTISHHRVSKFVIMALCFTGSCELICIVHCCLGFWTYCHTSFTLPMFEVIGSG